jgi:hypothetical protein
MRLSFTRFVLLAGSVAAFAAGCASNEPVAQEPPSTSGAAQPTGGTPPAAGCADGQACPQGQVCKTDASAPGGTCVRACQHAGKAYAVGEGFPSADGCNTCSCMEDGSVACTKKACACSPETETNRRYKMRDASQCKAALFQCDPGTKPFFSDCGCGCEQPATCPQFVNCMPGPGAQPCNEDEIKKSCPFTQIAH